MIIAIQKEKVESVDEKIILLTIIGCLEAIKNGGITIEEAEKFVFSPHMAKKLKMKDCDEEIIELILKGCELEDIASLIPQELRNILEKMQQEAMELIKKYEVIDDSFWLERV